MEPRIQEDTPRAKTQYVFSGIETNVSPMIRLLNDPRLRALAERFGFESVDYTSIPPAVDKQYSFTEPIGSMELGSRHVPSWDIKVLQGEISSALNYMTSSTTAGIYSNVRRIPQVDFELKYDVAVGTTDFFDITGPIRNQIISRIYDDGSFLYLESERPALIFAIDEMNAEAGGEYDIEVFEVLPKVKVGTDEQRPLRTLFFEKEQQKVVNDILILNTPDAPRIQLGPGDAEYYFQVNVDASIPEETICPRITDLRTRGLQIDDIPYDCPDVQAVSRLNVYNTNVSDSDIEVCNE